MTKSTDIPKEIAIGAVKSVLNAIPYVGPAIVEAFLEIPNRIAQQRKDKHFETVIQKLQTISENSIDLDFLQSEDFSELFQLILRKITFRKAAEKSEFFSNLTVACMLTTRSKQPFNWQIRFIEIIADLNESEMCLLLALNKHLSPSGASVASVSTPFGLDKKEFELCFDSLISKGLVFDASLSGIPQSVGSGVGHMPRPRERIDISPLAKMTIQFIPEIEKIVKNATSSPLSLDSAYVF
jgi:hypothetical protein